MITTITKCCSALSDVTRVQILAFVIQYKSVCVCDIENSFGMIQSRVSRHLKILKDAGFLEVERIGKWAYYFLTEDLDILHNTLVELIKTIEVPKLIKGCKT